MQKTQYTEKNILDDALSAQKAATDHYNSFANECVHENVRQELLNCLAEEHSIQQEVFCMMHDKGLYPTPEAEMQKVEQAKQKFAQCVK